MPTLAFAGEGASFSTAGFESNFTTASLSAGDWIIAYARWQGSSLVIGNVTCDGESNLTAVSSPMLSQGSNTISGQFFVLQVASGGAKTVRWAPPSGTTSGFALCGWSVTGGSLGVGTPAFATGSGVTPSVSITTATDHAGIIAVVRNDGGDMTSPGAGYTTDALANIWGYDQAEHISDVGTANTYSATATVPTGGWVIHAVEAKSTTLPSSALFEPEWFPMEPQTNPLTVSVW